MIREVVVKAKEQCRVVLGAEHYHKTGLQKITSSGPAGDMLNQLG